MSGFSKSSFGDEHIMKTWSLVLIMRERNGKKNRKTLKSD